MIDQRFTFESSAGCRLSACKMVPQKRKASLLIVHGMAEHKERYLEFAAFCAENGIAVYIFDLLGHGPEAAPRGYGKLPRKGWQVLKDDINIFSEIIREENGEAPFFILGHSFGSLLVRSLFLSGYCAYNGAILTGTPANPGVLGPFGVLAASLIVSFKGDDYMGPFLHNLAFASNSKSVSSPRTDFDWLSRNEESVDKYIADPLCGEIMSAGFYKQLALGFSGLFSPLKNSFVPVELPILIMSGSEDAVGKGRRGAKQAYSVYTKAGLTDVELRIYQGARHEILQETNRTEVFADILSWIDKRLEFTPGF